MSEAVFNKIAEAERICQDVEKARLAALASLQRDIEFNEFGVFENEFSGYGRIITAIQILERAADKIKNGNWPTSADYALARSIAERKAAGGS